MIKITILILLLFSGIGCAGEIVTEDNNNIFLYGEIENTVYMGKVNDEKTNYNRTVTINATVIEGEISIAGNNPYELEYNFLCDINDSYYINRILIINQTIEDGGWFSGNVMNRTLSLDGIIISNYQSKIAFFGKPKRNTVYFNLNDNQIRFGDQILNKSLAFTQLDYQDQQNYLTNTSGFPSFPLYHKYISVGLKGETSKRIVGLTGVFYNVFGASFITEIPIVGNTIANFGKAIQALLFLPLSVIQFMFNFIFTFINLIANNWWYGLLLLEIICMIPALAKDTYPDMVGTYIGLHVKIFVFLYEKVILNTINLIMRMIEIIRNMFRI